MLFLLTSIRIPINKNIPHTVAVVEVAAERKRETESLQRLRQRHQSGPGFQNTVVKHTQSDPATRAHPPRRNRSRKARWRGGKQSYNRGFYSRLAPIRTYIVKARNER